MISRRIWNQLTRRNRQPGRQKKLINRHVRGLRFEPLELRQMLSVTLGTLNDIQVPGGKTVLVPLSAADSDGEPITYSFQASDSNVALSLVSPGGHNLALTVTGTDGSGNPFNGTMVIHLFDDLAPNTTARIEQLANDGFYNGLPFTRVIDGFVAQGGDNGTGGTGQTIDDEFNPSLAFNSPGLLALANAGDDTSDSQFFITAIDGAGSTSAIDLANMPQFLNFNYTIFGQLVSGFDTFEKIMSTQVQLNQSSGETSQPVNPITITSASLVDDSHDGVLSVFVPADFAGNSASVIVTATNTDGLSSQQQFIASAVADTQVDPPFLGPVTDQVTTTGTPDVFTLTSTDLEGAGVTYFVVDAATGDAPANATIDIQPNGQVTVTPTAGFSGTIDLLAAVRSSTASNDISNFDTQNFTVTVTPPPTLGPVTDLTTTFDTQVGFTLTSTDTPGAGVFYAIGTTDDPSGVLINIDQSTGQVLIMPQPGFTGTAHLLAGVKSLTSPDVEANYNVQAFTVTVEPPPTLGTVSNQVISSRATDTFTLTSNSTTGSDVFFNVVDPVTLQAPTDVTVDVDPTTGQVTLTPIAGFTGTVQLLAEVRSINSPEDPSSYSTQEFTLTVNPPPTLGDVSDFTTVVGDPIHFTLTSDDPAGAGVFYTIVDASTLATPTIMSVTINQITGEVTLSPLPGFSGTFNLLAGVRANSDPESISSFDTKPFTVTINPGPSIGDVGNVTTTVGTPVSFTLTSSDPNGTGVFYELIDPSTLGNSPNATVSIDHATGEVTVTPNPGFTGPISLVAGVRAIPSFDIQADYSTQLITLNVTAGPTLGQVTNPTSVVGAPVSFDLTSTNQPDGGVFYELVDPTTLGAPQHVTVQIDHATGHVTLTPDNGFTGAIQLLAGVRGAASTEDPADYNTQVFTYDVTAGPTLGTVGNQTTTADTATGFTLTSVDPTGAGVVYEVVDPTTHGAPANVTATVNPTTGQVTLTPAAGFTGTINLLAGVRSVSSADDQANYTTQAFTLTVNAAAIALAPLHDIQVPGGQSVLVPLTGTDSAGNPITYTFSSSDPSVTLALVSPASKSLKLTVSGTDKNGNPFTGTLILHLFEDLTPLATTRIEQLVSQSFFNGQQFFRVIDGFVAQSSGDSNLGSFGNEIVPSLTFDSPGLLSFANAGANSNNSEIFITAIDNKGSTDPITLAREPQFLNGNFTILGQLVSGFDTFEKLMTTPVQASSTFNGEVSSPLSAITITSAEIITDTQDAVLKVTAPASFNNNSATITVTATNSSNQSTQQTFQAAVVVNPPTLGPVSNQTTPATTPVSFNLTSTPNDTTAGVTYNIFDAATHAAPTNVTVSINQSTGQVTLTPAAGFTGTLNLLGAVRATTATDTFANYDTQSFTLTVTPNAALKPTLGPVSNQSTTAGTPVTLTLTSTDSGGNGVVYKVADATTFGNPANATVTVDQATGHVTITPNAGFTGTISLLAGVRSSTDTDVQASYDTKAFTITVNAASTTIPTLGPITNQTTQVGVPVTFTLTSTDPAAQGVVYKIVDPTSFGAPANATVSINQTNGQVTLTPNAGFTGTINLLAEVRSSADADVQANYNTEAFTLTVTVSVPNAPTNLIVDASSNTGTFDGNGFISTSTPKLDVTGATGGTVQFKLNGVVIGTGTETATGSGLFTFTVPSGKLAIGSNTITSSVTTTGGTSVDSTALTLIYAPDYASGAYVVPGAPGTAQQVTIAWTARKAKYSDEIGYFIADSSDGSVGGISPGDPGYAQAALSSSSRHVIFAKGQTSGASSTISAQGGQIIVFYMIQNNTTAAFLANNPTDALHGNNNGSSPLAFFSLTSANPDGKQHTQIVADPTTGRVEYNWEDLASLGDSDFNDVVMTVRLASQSSKPPATVHAPGTGNKTVTVNGSLNAGHQQSTSGDLGVYFVDNPDGSIGTLKPGDAGYAAAALAAANSRVLFSAGSQAGGNQSVTVPAGKYLGFYIISNGTTANFLTANSANATGNGPVAMFSFDAANANSINHFRWYSPSQQQTDPSVQQLHIMDEVFGNESNFDDLTLNIDFSA